MSSGSEGEPVSTATNTPDGRQGRPLAAQVPYEALFDAVSDAILVADADGRYIDANPAAAHLLGYTRNELLQMGVADVVAHEPTWTDAEYARYREDGQWRGELVLRRKDGASVPVEARASVVDLPQSQLFVSTVRDLSAERLAEDRLRYQRQITETIAERAGEAFFVMDANGRVTYLNPAAEDLFGWGDGTMLGEDLHEVLHYQYPDGSPYLVSECRLRTVLLTGEAVQHHEDVFFTRSGRAIPVRCSNAPIEEEGRIIGAVLVVSDISDRIAAEAERERLLQALAHDLKNPLAVLKGQAQLLRRQVMRRGMPEPEALIDKLDGFVRLTGRINNLVDELGDHARVAAGEPLELEREPVDLVAVVDAAVDELNEAARSHTLELEIETRPVVGEWNAQRLRRIVSNLLDNAVKYSPEGSRVVIGITAESDSAVLTVRDEGIGIPEADVPHVFGFQTRASNVGTTPGSGIGLAGAKWIVEQHGGSIGFVSNEGFGTTFTVRLPLAATDSSVPEPPGQQDGATSE
jgi:PAS domain S-box-containing protein